MCQKGGEWWDLRTKCQQFPLRNEDIRTPPMSSMARCPQYQGDHHGFGGGIHRLMGDTYQHEHQVGGRPSEEYRSGHMLTNSVPCNGQHSSFGSFQTAPEESLLQGSFQSGRFKTYKPEKYDGTSDWTDYLKHFEIYSTWIGWSELDKAAQLSMSMTGVA